MPSSQTTIVSANQLKELLQNPSTSLAQQNVASLTLPTSPAELKSSLQFLLDKEQRSFQEVEQELTASSAQVSNLLASAKSQVASVSQNVDTIRVEHDLLEDAIIDQTETLQSGLAKKELGDLTLNELLADLSAKRKNLELLKDWFGVLANVEYLGAGVLKSLEDENLQRTFDKYIELAEFIDHTYTTAPTLQLTTQVISMASSVWLALVKTLSKRVVEHLTKLGWPSALQDAILEEGDGLAFKNAFIDMIKLEKIQTGYPLPIGNQMRKKREGDAKPLVALHALVQPLLLRFKWQFEGNRGTNRIDKPEYPLSYVLNLISTHESFLEGEIQQILNNNGFEQVNALVDFITLLLPSLSSRLRHHVPQLLALPPILAHTIYQTLEFDSVLHSKGYRPRGHSGDWNGLSEVILGRKEWFQTWLDAEQEFFDTKYYNAISAPDAWQILSEEDYDASESMTGIRPTNSSLKVAEITSQLSSRYRPLPTQFSVDFLFKIHIPILNVYAERIGSALLAFESLSFGFLPGALSDNRGATSGVGGQVRLVRAGVSARWMEERCVEWGEDPFYLGFMGQILDAHLSLNETHPEIKNLVVGGTLFDKPRKEFAELADKADELIIRHVIREVMNELKPYLGRRWDPTPLEEGTELSLSPDLGAPLSLFSSLLSTLVTSYPSTMATSLYRRISALLSTTLYDLLLVNRTWSETGARQLNYDIEYGFLQAAREAGVTRGITRGWELLIGSAKIMMLPTTDVSQPGSATFSSIMKLAFDETIPQHTVAKALEDIGISELLAKKDTLKDLLRRRPECWR